MAIQAMYDMWRGSEVRASLVSQKGNYERGGSLVRG